MLFASTQNAGATWPDPTKVFLSGEERAWERGWVRGRETIDLWRYERSSRLIRNLSNCEREAWKKFRLQRDSNPWPLRYRCSALPTELWSHNCWEQVNFSGSIMPLRVIQHYSDWVFVPRLWVMTLWIDLCHNFENPMLALCKRAGQS